VRLMHRNGNYKRGTEVNRTELFGYVFDLKDFVKVGLRLAIKRTTA